jgi:4-cresol dehydrogenase (hydroxylating) flavoprotein subunit
MTSRRPRSSADDRVVSPKRPRGGATAAPAPENLGVALASWERVVGEEHVKIDGATVAHYGRTTGTHAHQPLAVIYPESTDQVREVLRIASKQRVGVHAISRGKNWGYGDAAAMGENQVILDLRRMNRIVEVNRGLCYAVVEPGVTQGQLYDYLQEHKTGLWMDSSGAGRGASIIGNTLERGFGHTRYGDHFQSICGMQVVLADGRVLNTGLGHYEKAKAHRAYQYGVGPCLDGIFTQSNFGVVTQLGVALMPAPQAFCAFFVLASEETDLVALVDRLAELRRQGVLQSTIHIGNDLRIISGKMRYPWERAGGKTPLPRELRAELRRELGLGYWNAGGAIYGTRETVAATRKTVRRALRGFRISFLDDRKLALVGRVVGMLRCVGLGRKLGERLESVKPVYGLLKGIPTDEPLKGVGWRVRGAAPAEPIDPLDAHVGLMWVAPALPAKGTFAQELMRLVEPIYEKHGFDAAVTFTLITERALIAVTNVSFDEREPEEAARAQDCYAELTERLMAEGYVPYRTGPAGMGKLACGSSVFWDVAGQIKEALDPAGVISPGRYVLQVEHLDAARKRAG